MINPLLSKKFSWWYSLISFGNRKKLYLNKGRLIAGRIAWSIPKLVQYLLERSKHISSPCFINKLLQRYKMNWANILSHTVYKTKYTVQGLPPSDRNIFSSVQMKRTINLGHSNYVTYTCECPVRTPANCGISKWRK